MEVIARIRFTTPCLGAERKPRCDTMLRDKEGRVILMQSWWRSALRFAAKAMCRHQDDIENIQVDPVVDGTTRIYKRYFSTASFQEHECFDAGDEITVRFCLPNAIPVESFTELLSTAGKYVGISPYGFKLDFGRFAVLEVVKKHAGNNPKKPQPDSSRPGPELPTGPVADVHKA